ncbi:UNVERIFIED_CONTAM: hypothetical protein RMT77_015796 [Armadillidium vulgare]
MNFEAILLPKVKFITKLYDGGTTLSLAYASSCARQMFKNGKSSRGFSTSENNLAQQERIVDWNRAVSDAEKIVGYPTSYLTLRSLFSDEMSNLAVHLRKLVGTSHPLLKTAKKLVYNGKNNIQTRGLIILLLSKAAGNIHEKVLEQDIPEGVSHNQRSLAEIIEMIHASQLIHKGVVNLCPPVCSDETTLTDMTFGNKIAILSGDYLLANACTGLAALNNSRVVELVSNAISDLTEAEFIGKHDALDNSLPSSDITIEDWEQKRFLSAGSLLANSCQGAVLLAGHGEEKQKVAFEFGKLLSFAWQVHSELQPFLDPYSHPPGTPFDLTSAPVVLHFTKERQNESVKAIMDIVNSSAESIENCDFEQIHNLILKGSGVVEAQNLCSDYKDAALKTLKSIQPSEARTALENIVNALAQ